MNLSVSVKYRKYFYPVFTSVLLRFADSDSEPILQGCDMSTILCESGDGE